MKQKQQPRKSLTASAVPVRTPGLLTHLAAKHAKQAERQRLREDRHILRRR